MAQKIEIVAFSILATIAFVSIYAIMEWYLVNVVKYTTDDIVHIYLA